MKQKIRVIFSKTGDMRFISHLDLVRLFQRACRRAEMPVVLTKGFNPRMKISIAKALKLGIESRNEEAVFYMDERLEPGYFKEKLNNKLPDGIEILAAEGEDVNA